MCVNEREKEPTRGGRPNLQNSWTRTVNFCRSPRREETENPILHIHIFFFYFILSLLLLKATVCPFMVKVWGKGNRIQKQQQRDRHDGGVMRDDSAGFQFGLPIPSKFVSLLRKCFRNSLIAFSSQDLWIWIRVKTLTKSSTYCLSSLDGRTALN